jgi:hypothetical protein
VKWPIGLSLRFAADKSAITRTDASSQKADYDSVLKAIDAIQDTISVSLGRKSLTLALLLAKDADIITACKTNGRWTYDRKAKLTDLEPGMRVCLTVELDAGKMVVKFIKGDK